MFMNAVGFFTEDVEEKQTEKNGKEVKRTKKYYQPNVIAGIFLLTNWKPDEYKHKMEMNETGEKVVKIQGLPDNPQELMKFRDAILAAKQGKTRN